MAQGPLKPTKEYKVKPDKYGLKYEEKETTTADGVKLKIWVFPVQNGKSTKYLLVSHDGQGNMSDHIDRVYRFASKGYNVIFYDYRGFGESDAFEYEANMYINPLMCKDYEAMLNFVKFNYSSIIHTYGWGVGATLTLGMGLNSNLVFKMVADTPCNTLEDHKKRYKATGAELEIPPFGFDKKYEPIFALDTKGKTAQQFMVIVGESDPVYGVKETAEVTKRTKSATLWSQKGLTYDQLYTNDKDAYINKVVAFLDGQK